MQRGNPEIQRRAQEVIDRCWQMGAPKADIAAPGDGNPILSIHDVGAGGLSNAFPELAHSGQCGARFDLRAVPIEEPGMSPAEIWSNESQERYVLAIPPSRLGESELFRHLPMQRKAGQSAEYALLDGLHALHPFSYHADDIESLGQLISIAFPAPLPHRALPDLRPRQPGAVHRRHPVLQSVPEEVVPVLKIVQRAAR